MSILSANYKSAGLSVPSKTAYVAVDPKLYQGTWSGTYPDKKTFQLTVTDVNGFRAQGKYQSGSTVKYQSVLIKDKSFRIADTKFTLTKPGTAQTKTIITHPTTATPYLTPPPAPHTSPT